MRPGRVSCYLLLLWLASCSTAGGDDAGPVPTDTIIDQSVSDTRSADAGDLSGFVDVRPLQDLPDGDGLSDVGGSEALTDRVQPTELPTDGSAQPDESAPIDAVDSIAPEQVQPQYWSAMTMNLQCYQAEASARHEAIAQAAADKKVDLLLLQEVCVENGLNSAEFLAKRLTELTGKPYTPVFAPTHIAWDKWQEGIGIVFQGKLVHSQALALPVGLFPRKAIWVRFDGRLGRLDGLSTHLSFGPQQADVRLAQAQAIATFIQDKVLPDGHDLILGGDFNDTPGSPTLQAFTGSGWKEAWQTLMPGQPGHTYPAGDASSKIDHLLAPPGSPDPFAQVELMLNQPLPQLGGEYASDHYGVWVMGGL